MQGILPHRCITFNIVMSVPKLCISLVGYLGILIVTSLDNISYEGLSTPHMCIPKWILDLGSY